MKPEDSWRNLKRKHRDDDDVTELMPISKRINSLNLNGQVQNGVLMPCDRDISNGIVPSATNGIDPSTSHGMMPSTSHGMPSTSHGMMPSISHGIIPSANHGMMPSTSNGMMPSTSRGLEINVDVLHQREQKELMEECSHGELMSIYTPELGKNANPFYYDINGLLFSLHLEKVKRSGCISCNVFQKT